MNRRAADIAGRENGSRLRRLSKQKISDSFKSNAWRNAMSSNDSARLFNNFLDEYSTEESVRRYTPKTAGHGISYLLDHDYGRIYLDSVRKYLPESRLKTGLR